MPSKDECVTFLKRRGYPYQTGPLGKYQVWVLGEKKGIRGKPEPWP